MVKYIKLSVMLANVFKWIIIGDIKQDPKSFEIICKHGPTIWPD